MYGLQPGAGENHRLSLLRSPVMVTGSYTWSSTVEDLQIPGSQALCLLLLLVMVFGYSVYTWRDTLRHSYMTGATEYRLVSGDLSYSVREVVLLSSYCC